MKVRKRTVLRRTLALLSIAVVFPALGCAGKTVTTGQSQVASDTGATSGVTAQSGLPEELHAVTGRTETSAGEWSLWYVARGGEVLADLPANHVLASGERSSVVVYSDLDTGGLYVWHPGESSPDDISTIDLATGVPVLGDVMAVSPDGSRLALVRYRPMPGSTGEADETVAEARGSLVDLQTGASKEWGWLETVGTGDEVTALQWNETSSSLYVSFGPGGGSQGERSYRYDLASREPAELEGVAAVLDVGPRGQVVGLGAARSPSDLDYPAGSQYGYLPLVLWTDGELVRLPRDPDLASWDRAWISDDGKTIVIRGSHARGDEQQSCLEVLGLGDAGWEVRRVYDGGESIEIVYGIAYGPGAGRFYFQGGMPPSIPGGSVTDVRLFGMDITTGQVSPYVSLPGGDDGRYVQALSVVGPETEGR